MFAPLRAFVSTLPQLAWPGPPELNLLAGSRGVRSGGDQPLRFELQDGEPAAGATVYESRIHDGGVVPLRGANWHDFFNALVWLAFPQSKAMLNRIHVAELRTQMSGLRSARRDALTLFDESGVVVVSSDPRVLQWIRAFEWQRLFWRERALLARTTRFLLFGHALYEKALAPYVGMTGHAVLLDVPEQPDLYAAQDIALLVDGCVAKVLFERINKPVDLSPLPVLGVPGWWPANGEASFYENTNYFRTGRSRRLPAARADVAH